MSINQELELTMEMLQRNDDIDNAVFQCVCILAEKELEWDMQIIGNVTDAIKKELGNYNISVRHPGVFIDEKGKQHYGE